MVIFTPLLLVHSWFKILRSIWWHNHNNSNKNEN